MISVLLPVYNFDVREITYELNNQLVKEKINFEIILIDDGSENKFKELNRGLSTLEHVSYSEEKVNLGRSKIRNKLASKAKNTYLLFIDCDSGIPNKNYISNYLNTAKKNPIIYGGTVYEKISPSLERFKLHWLYGKNREQNTAKNRNVEPNKSFHTNNFMISRDLFLQIRFNEKIVGYGHEDTLFGYELQKNKIHILHIDNPVIHLGLESNEEFLRKTREGIKNLKLIMSINGNEKRLVKDITLLGFYKRLEKFRLTHFIELLYKRYEHKLRRNLLSTHPNLIVFDIYKLGYLCSLNQHINKA